MKPGDVVRLKSGGPAMTVAIVQGNGHLWCEWFAEGGIHARGFAPATLQPVEGAS